MSTLTYTGRLVVTSCWCGIHVAIPKDLHSYAVSVGCHVYCPLGHQFVYRDTVKAANERLQRELADTKTRLVHARDAEEYQRRRVIAYKGVLGKTRKRIAAGVCPCCTRTFQNLARHIATKHPGYPEISEGADQAGVSAAP